MSTNRKTAHGAENRWALDAEGYRNLKATALNLALQASGPDALRAAIAVRTNLVQLLAVFALFGAKGDNDARRLVPGLDARAPSKHSGGDLRMLAERRLLQKAAGRASLSKVRLARMAKALVG
jgi:hypothetical protein